MPKPPAPVWLLGQKRWVCPSLSQPFDSLPG